MVAVAALAGASSRVAVGFIPDVNSLPASGGQMTADSV